MSYIDTLVERNQQFAAKQVSAHNGMPSIAEAMLNVRALVIGCVDMRVDPAYVLGLQSGEAAVLRNIGGRVTPGVLLQLGMLGRVGQVAGKKPGGGGDFHLVVMQHTDCGITQLRNDPAMLAQFFQISEVALAAKHILDPRAAVAVDVEVLRSVPALPAEWFLSGLVYDVATAKVEVVVPPAPVR